MINILIYLVCFLIFVVLQSLAINGWHQSFQEGMIFNKVKLFFKDKLHENVQLPLWGCIRCESSVVGGAIFWGTVIPILGFHWIEIWVYILDVFILVYLNFLFYKRQ